MDTIENEKYKLTALNYIPEGTNKDRIVIGNTYSTDMRHYIGWEKRWNGEYKKTAMFTISMDGEIHQHFSPNYYSDFMGDDLLNEGTISILLENEGWLIKDLIDENKYVNYIGHIYNRKDSVIEKRWRNHTYWAPYTQKQTDSVYELVKQLCIEYDIPMKVIGHNTSFDTVEVYNGILYKSNFEKHYTDISPAWDCLEFKNKIELN